MNRLILFLVFIGFISNPVLRGQINYENSYLVSPYFDRVFPVHLDNYGTKWCMNIPDSNKFVLYNLDHTLFTTINVPEQAGSSYSLYYVTDNLFDSDDEIEYLLADHISKIIIYNEDGSVLLLEDPASISGGSFGGPIFNTEDGAKMRIEVSGISKIYGLPGTLLTQDKETADLYNSGYVSMAYPNPNKGSFKIDFQLPEGISEGQLIFYSMTGEVVKAITLKSQGGSIEINNSTLPMGTYLYQLNTRTIKNESKRVIVIH